MPMEFRTYTFLPLLFIYHICMFIPTEKAFAFISINSFVVIYLSFEYGYRVFSQKSPIGLCAKKKQESQSSVSENLEYINEQPIQTFSP